MEKQEIINKIQSILLKRFNFNIENNWMTIKDTPLLGYKVGFGPAELLYLFFDIEEEFNIRIPENYIVKGDFISLNRIVNVVSDLSRE